MMQFGGILTNGQVALATPGLYLRPSSTSYNLTAFQFTPIITPSAAGTYTFGYSIRADGFLDNKAYGTLNNWANFYCDGGGTISSGQSGTGTIVNNAYSLYIAAPNFGTNKYCAYFNGLCGFGTTSPIALVDISGTTSNVLLNINGIVNISSLYAYPIFLAPNINVTGNSNLSLIHI